MKRYIVPAVFGLMMVAGLPACLHHGNNISISFTDDEDEFEMEADYPRRKAHHVKVFLDDHLLNYSKHRGWHRFSNEEITLDDNTRFYIDAGPGEVRVRLDKDENSEAGCERVRQLCKDLKLVIEEN